MATVYTKATGVAVNSADLLTKLSTFMVANGFVLEFSGDNIISSKNLGKKYIFSKASRYYYFAASDLNCPSGDNSNYTNKGISALGVTISKTLNTTNNWPLNNPQSDVVIAENKPSSNYFFYVKGNNIIIVLRWAANQYSYIFAGDIKNLQAGSEAWVCSGSSLESVSSSSSVTRLRIYPIFNAYVLFGWADGTYIRRDNTAPRLEPNTFNSNNYFPCIDASNGNGGILNKTDNTLNGVSVTWDFKIYKSLVIGSWFSFARVEDLYLVNFANLIPEQQYVVGSRKYDVFPFLQKETPQNYQPDSNSMGFGFAVKTDE